ncbi:MAG: hypothetical protein AB9873_15165 [Syntrophobacteraceae bacterium]
MRRNDLNNALQHIRHFFFIKLPVCRLTFKPFLLADSPEEVKDIELSMT